MKQNNENWAACYETVRHYLGILAAPDSLAYGEKKFHRAETLSMLGADQGSREEWRSTARHIGRMLAGLRTDAPEEEAEAAQEVLFLLPDSWDREAVAGLLERAEDVSRGRVPLMSCYAH